MDFSELGAEMWKKCYLFNFEAQATSSLVEIFKRFLKFQIYSI